MATLPSALFRQRLLVSCAMLACGAGIAMPAPAAAANMAAQLRKDFARLTLNGADGAKMKPSANGRDVIIEFNQPVPVTIDGITQNLKPYILNARQSPDQRQVILTMQDDYPIRSFISGTTSGVDILFKGRPKPERVVTDKTPLPSTTHLNPSKGVDVKDSILTTYKGGKNSVFSTQPSNPALKVAETSAVPSVPLLTKQPVQTPSSAPRPEPKAPKVITTKAPGVEKGSRKKESILQTKPVAKAEPKQTITALGKQIAAIPIPVKKPEMQESVKTAQAAPPVLPENTPIPAPAAPRANPLPEAIPVVPEPTLSTREEKEQAAQARISALMNSHPLVVGLKGGPVDAQLFFPFNERTAAASFTLGHNLYVVFNSKRQIDIKNLTTILPRYLTSVQQLPSEKGTVLRFVTDGEVYTTANLTGNGYEWVVDASRRPKIPKITTLPNVVSAPPLPAHVELEMVQMGDVITVIDSVSGDDVDVVPGYEGNHGVFPERILPDATVLRTGQGMAYLPTRPDVRLMKLRSGLRLSVPGGLAVSKNLAALPADAALADQQQSFTFYPYSQWKAADNTDFYAKERELFADISTADSKKAPLLRMKLAELYLSEGMHMEALGVLDIIHQDTPDVYDDYQLSALAGAANFMIGRFDAAAQNFTHPTVKDEEEAKMWQRMLEVLDGAGKNFDYFTYNQHYIRFYPPDMRRRIALLAADNALAQGKIEAVQKIFAGLAQDKLTDSLEGYKQYMLGRIYAEAGKFDKAEEKLKPLIDNPEDRFLRARAAFTLATSKYKAGLIDRPALIAALEPLRYVWRGDAFELNLLNLLGELYANNGQYLDALRAWNDAVTYYPDTAVARDASGRMAAAFVSLFNEGKANNLTPLSALALYYEFRDLTPLGRPGDVMIQHLADRLAGVDLLDRAASLLQHQVTYRLEKEERSRVGARLALIYLLNREPDKTLETLELTGYGDNGADLNRKRNHLAALAQAKLGNWQRALNLLRDDFSPEAKLIRADIYWDNKDWDNVAKSVEDIMASRKDITAPLNDEETQALLKMAVAYTYRHETDQLQYLRDYFLPLVKDKQRKDTLDFITSGIDPVNRNTIERLSAEMGKMKGFLDNYKVSLSKEGLSSVID